MTDLAAWLTQILDDEEAALLPLLSGARRNGKTTTRRLLARIAADRQICTQYIDARETFASIQELFADDNSPFARAECAGYSQAAHALGTVVRLLALPYADRPGYRAEWKPDAPG